MAQPLLVMLLDIHHQCDSPLRLEEIEVPERSEATAVSRFRRVQETHDSKNIPRFLRLW